MSKHQENGLLLTIVSYLAGCVAIAALFVIFMPQIERAVPEAGFVLALIIGGVLLLRFGWSTASMIADLWHGRVESVEGPVTLLRRRAKYSTSYYYVCEAHRFQVPSSAYHALIEANLYRIHYTPRSRRLASIKPIGESQDPDRMNRSE